MAKNGILVQVKNVSELSKAIRRKDTVNIREEFADVFAWTCSLANLLDIDLLDVAFEKYPGICPRCAQEHCQCKT